MPSANYTDLEFYWMNEKYIFLALDAIQKTFPVKYFPTFTALQVIETFLLSVATLYEIEQHF